MFKHMHVSLDTEDLLDANRQSIAKILKNRNQDVNMNMYNKDVFPLIIGIP
jgi:hypothetical protein